MANTRTLLALWLGLAAFANAHMEMKYPPPFKSKYNPYAGQDIDYSMTSPLKPDGSDFPCKGYQSLLGTKEGSSVVTWTPGQKYNMTITGQTNHGGGSCQASLSYDKGKSFTVVHSYIGSCPPMGDSDWSFTLPDDTPSGDALFAWSWFNQIGNREMYMNCAHVTIAGGGKSSKAKRDDPSIGLNSRPAMFVANVGNGCSTPANKDLVFPDPGPDTDKKTSKPAGPLGKCATGSGSSSGSGSGSGSGSSGSGSSEPASSPSSTPAASPSAPASSAAASSQGGVFVTTPAAASSTLLTITVPSSPGNAPSPTTPSAPAATTPSTGSGSGTGSGSSGGSGGGSGGYSSGTACSDVGEWNCVGGTQFQRCGPGGWTALMPVAAGTSCNAGTSDNFDVVVKGARVRRRQNAARV